ncbi:extracellular solute-binding protein [Spongiactinospora sp. 9N601]|uniref:extracellular solute-binding protein n=1 Tax=Spongiactinospora sp. 9N601 TaxID=3375149 RepID=UPI0037995F35
MLTSAALVAAMITVGARGTAAPAPKCPKKPGLTLATGNDVSKGGFRHDMIGIWNSRNPSSKDVTIIELDKNTDEVRAAMVAKAQAGSCAFDILALDVAWVTEFARRGYVREIRLRPQERAQFLEKPLDTGLVDGRQYAVPFYTDSQLLFRRSGLPAARTPAHFATLVSIYKLAAQLGDYEGGTVNILQALHAGGAKIDDGDEIVLDEPENAGLALSALRRLNWMLRKNTLVKHTEFMDEEASLTAFENREAGYMLSWPSYFHRLAASPSMLDEGSEPMFTVSPVPGAGVLGGSDLAISSNSAKYSEARELIMFLAGAEIQERLFACGGYAPVVKVVYETYRTTPRTCEELPWGEGAPPTPVAGDDIEPPDITAAQLSEFAAVIRRAVEGAVARPPATHYATFSEVFRNCTRRVIVNELASENLDFGRFADALRAALDGRRYDEDPCQVPQ